MPGLVTSDEGRKDLTTLVGALLDRQVKNGDRKGSFQPKRANAFYWDYTAPLAILAAAEDLRTSKEDKQRYLTAVQSWLSHTYQNQNEDGTIKPFGQANPDEVILESSAGAAWVASRYRVTVADLPDRDKLMVISEENPKAFHTLVARSVNALATSQGSDGLILTTPQSKEMPASIIYYTTNAHMHAALASVAKSYPPESPIHKDAKAIESKLVKGLKGFTQSGQDNVPFMKGDTEDSFQQYKGHHVIVNAYSGALEGDSAYTKSLKTEFEQAMSTPVRKKEFYAIQTVPSSVTTGLSAAGYKTVTIDDKEVPLSAIAEEQLKLLLPEARKTYVHKIATAVMVGYQGSEWLPPLEPAKEQSPQKEEKKEPLDIARAQARDALAQSGIALAGGSLPSLPFKEKAVVPGK